MFLGKYYAAMLINNEIDCRGELHFGFHYSLKLLYH